MPVRKLAKSSKDKSSKAGRKSLAHQNKPTGRKAPASKRGPRYAPPGPSLPRLQLLSSLSLDRKLDLLGVAMTLLGLITLLSLLSTNHSSLIGFWVSAIRSAFGWGMYAFPLGLIVLGLWMILRHFDRLPNLALERAVGLVLLYFNLLTALHFFHFPEDRAISFALASAGRGGGYMGAAILAILRSALGWGGTAVVLAAWLLIALAFTLDVSVQDLFGWTPPLFVRVKNYWKDWFARRAALRKSSPGSSFVPMQEPRSQVVQDEDPSGRYEVPAYPPLATAPDTSTRQWVLPSINEILDTSGVIPYDDEFDRQRARIIEETLASFGAPARVVEINRGPTITQFGVEPGYIETRNGSMRVRVSKIASLVDDLALALSAKRIRIQAPVPNKGFVGIEVPNEQISLVALRDIIEREAFRSIKSPLRFALGQDVAGNAVAADLAAMPHLLIAGTTGSGKSVCVNSLICCLLLHNTPGDLRLVMVDPKRVELTGYNGIPHLLAPVVVELERVIYALQWVAGQMDHRYKLLAQAGARSIDDYNARLEAQGEAKLPHLVVIIDELADLMMLAPDETERTLTRLAQLARATGIHLVIATQRPSVDVVTGLIKANFPARIAFAVASGVDSRVILDQPGAERLLGRGDMLFQAPDAAAPVRLQGPFVSEAEIQRLVYYWRSFAGLEEAALTAAGGPVDAMPPGIPLRQLAMWGEMVPEEQLDPLYDDAVELVRQQKTASISMLQRRLRIGYTRAARLIETMQERGILGPAQPGSQGLEVLDFGQTAPKADDQR